MSTRKKGGRKVTRRDAEEALVRAAAALDFARDEESEVNFAYAKQAFIAGNFGKATTLANKARWAAETLSAHRTIAKLGDELGKADSLDTSAVQAVQALIEEAESLLESRPSKAGFKAREAARLLRKLTAQAERKAWLEGLTLGTRARAKANGRRHKAPVANPNGEAARKANARAVAAIANGEVAAPSAAAPLQDPDGVLEEAKRPSSSKKVKKAEGRKPRGRQRAQATA